MSHLDEVSEGLGVTGGLSENVLDAGVGENLLGGGTSNETSTLKTREKRVQKNGEMQGQQEG